MIMLRYGRASLWRIQLGGSPRSIPLPCQLLRIYAGTHRWQTAEQMDWPQRRHNSDSGNRTLTLENTFKCYDLETGPPMDVELSREDALDMYTKMVEVRRVELLAAELYKQKKIRGFCHLYNGQEAVAVGMAAMLRKMDSVITAYRCHAWTYLMGVTMYAMLAELVGVRTGCSRGKGGSMHMYADNYYGGNGIVGAQVPVGAGIALAHRYKDDGGVCVVCYGDGAANQGQIFEAYNMAKLWCLPCIFVCENNVYGMGTEASRASANTEFYMRGQYIPGLWVDGNQVLAVRSATQFAIDFVQSNGPIVLEMYTYRYMGHSMSDPGTSYRSRDEIQEVRDTRDPIVNFRNQMVALCLATEEELKTVDTNVKKQMDVTVKKVLQDREVDVSELAADVYARNLEPKIRGVSRYNLEHKQIAEVCMGKPKATPANEIKDVPVGAEAVKAQQEEIKKKAAEKAGAKPPAKEGDEKKPDAPPGEAAPKATDAPPATPPAPAAAAAAPAPTPAPAATPATTKAPAKAPAAPAAKPPAKPAAKPPAKAPAAKAPAKAPAKPAPSAKAPAPAPAAPKKPPAPASKGAPKPPSPPKDKSKK